MRFSTRIHRRRILTAIICLLVAGFACAKRPPAKKIAPKTPELQVVEPKQKSTRLPPTPQQQAAYRIVEKGLAAMQKGDYPVAQQFFQDAANVDPQNGVPYYYLAKVSFLQGDSETALGFLEKARGILEEDDHWKKEIEALYLDITGEPLPAEKKDRS